MKLADRLEYATAADPARNYCLWDYAPVAPAEDKFRSINLLYESFEAGGAPAEAYRLVDAVRDAIGSFRTVYGVKRTAGRTSWEFYFYDYARQQRENAVARVLQALGPWMPSRLVVNEQLPYFMFSIDVVPGAPLDAVHLYIGNPGSTVSSGIAYALTEQGCALENFYFFFDAGSQLDEVADKVMCSAHIDPSRVALDDILLPALRGCRTICVANKSGHDCIYFSGVDVEQLLYFLDRFDHLQTTRSFVREHRARFDHLLFDVGFDYRGDGARVVPIKSGYYGVF